jgi:hypothetical protein
METQEGQVGQITKSGMLQQIPMEFRGSSIHIFKFYIPINPKI